MKARETRFLSVTQLLRYKYYRSILLYSVALVFVLVLIVGLLFSSLYNSYSQDLMQNYAEDMLAQRVYSAELLGEEMESLATAIYTDQEVSQFFQAKQEDKILKYTVGRTLSKYKSLYSFVENISLVNAEAHFSVSTLNYGEDPAFFSENATLGTIVWVPRIIPPPSFRYQDLPVLSMLYPISHAGHGSISGGIVLDIDQNHLQALLQFTDVLPGAHTVILNEEGVVVSASTQQLFLSSYTGKGYTPRILDASASNGSFVWEEDHVRTLITWEKLPDRNWFVVCSLPVSNLQARFAGIIQRVLLGLLGVLVMAILAAILASRSVYRPIQTLVRAARVTKPEGSRNIHNEIDAVAKKINTMQEDHAQMRQTMHLTMVQHLLFGLPVNIQEHDTVLRDAEVYCVATIRLASLSTEQETNDQLTVAAGHIAVEMLREICPCESAAWSNAAVVILCLKQEIIPDAVLLALDNACKWCEENLGHQAISSLSGMVRSPDQIHDAYLEAQLISQQSFYDPRERVFTSAVLQQWQTDSRINSEWWGQRFASLILEDDMDCLSEERKELSKLLYSKPPYLVRQAAAEILMQLYAKFENSGLPKERFRKDILIPALQTAESWEETERIIDAGIEDCHQLTGSYGQGLRNRRLIHDVCAWVQANYSNPSLSLQSAADYAGLSASYLGRVFKSIEGQSFTEYVTAVRLEEAARQLIETDKSISSIACDVGMENQSYFSSLFKKEYGITPSTYRQTNTSGGKA